MGSPRSLDGLPSELIHKILEHINPVTYPRDELYALSLLSRRLHYICLPLLLQQMGADPAKGVKITLTALQRRERRFHPDALSGLRLALYISSLDEISISFARYWPVSAWLWAGGDLSEEIASLMYADVCRVQMLVAKMSYIRAISLNVGDIHVAVQQCKEEDKSLLFQSIEELLCLSSAKASCVKVTGFHSDTVLPFKSQRPNSKVKLIKELSRTSGSEAWKHSAGGSECSIRSIFLSPHIRRDRPKLTIHTLIIHSALFLTPPFFFCVLQALRGGTVKKLELVDIRDLFEDEWKTFLSSLEPAAGAVQEFVLNNCNKDSLPYFISLLSKVRRLLTFRLECKNMSPSDWEVHQWPSLRFLSHLIAPSALVCVMLARKRLSSALRNLCVLEEFNGQSNLSDLDLRFDEIYQLLVSQKITSLSDLSFKFSFECRYGDTDAGLVFASQLARFTESKPSLVGFVHVVEILLVLNYDLPDWPEHRAPNLHRWLECFPNARSFGIEVNNQAQRPEKMLPSLAESLFKSCRGLRSIYICCTNDDNDILISFSSFRDTDGPSSGPSDKY